MDISNPTSSREQLIAELLDPNIPKSERERAAAIEIEWLRNSIRQIYDSYNSVSLYSRICDSNLPIYIVSAAELVIIPQNKVAQ